MLWFDEKSISNLHTCTYLYYPYFKIYCTEALSLLVMLPFSQIKSILIKLSNFIQYTHITLRIIYFLKEVIYKSLIWCRWQNWWGCPCSTGWNSMSYRVGLVTCTISTIGWTSISICFCHFLITSYWCWWWWKLATAEYYFWLKIICMPNYSGVTKKDAYDHASQNIPPMVSFIYNSWNWAN